MDLEIQEKKESLLWSNQQSSLTLTKIKSSLTLDQTKKIPTQFSYFYQKGQEVIPIKLSSRIYTVREAIEYGIEALNQEHGLNLINEYQLFNLYAAKKTGKKKSDLPSLEYSQMLQKTKFQAFVIIPKPDAIVNMPIKNTPIVETTISKKNPVVNGSKPEHPVPPKLNGKRSSAEEYPYYASTTEILPKLNPRKEIPPEPSVGCFCFRKRS